MCIGWLVTVTLIAIICAYGTTCLYTKIKREAAYDSVNVGDTEDFVIAQFGTPSVRENPDQLFARYVSSKCQLPCVERLWFENRLLLDIEAWSVSLGNDRRVVENYHWVSP
jgi:hypothetical protein